MQVTVEIPVARDAFKRQLDRRAPDGPGLLAFRSESYNTARPHVFGESMPPTLHSISVAIDPNSEPGQLILRAFELLGYYPNGDRGDVHPAYEV